MPSLHLPPFLLSFIPLLLSDETLIMSSGLLDLSGLLKVLVFPEGLGKVTVLAA
jgi:hypothetical protein